MANDSGSNSNEGNIPIEDLRSIEAWVASARHYVVPTDDLRPRVLDSATGSATAKFRNVALGMPSLRSRSSSSAGEGSGSGSLVSQRTL